MDRSGDDRLGTADSRFGASLSKQWRLDCLWARWLGAVLILSCVQLEKTMTFGLPAEWIFSSNCYALGGIVDKPESKLAGTH